MAESKEMLLDVKLDLKNIKNDLLKNWSPIHWMKCVVKIEAIKCFPCYLRISFYHENDVQRECLISSLKLNIPGVRVGSAASRTKSFAYRVFWKHNRKQCRLFLAFADKQSCSSHMKWLKQSIDSLENYRKEIFENHRISRVIQAGEEDELNVTKNNLNDTQSERDLNDIFGPLPDIPISIADCSNRLSLRRSSGCSGIYEEILDPSDVNFKTSQKDDESRESIVSSIYVDMTTPLKINECAEMPPPLPPRRQKLNMVYTPVQVDTSSKTRKSTWNLKNVFGRAKATEAAKISKAAQVVKSQTAEAISNLCSNDYQSNLLASGKISFSTPDLMNIVDANRAATAPIKCDNDEGDLDIMDIERSNSLNCSTNQFNRPVALNISDNVLWSHNLSLTLSSNCNASAINLVGANVNGHDSFLGRDSSGYCKMAPILNKADRFKVQRTSTAHFENQLALSNQQLDSSSIYCTMAPIMQKTDGSLPAKVSDSILLKNITFERTFEFDEDRSLSLDCSMKSFENSNAASLSDITTSSGVSSYDGSIAAINSRCMTPVAASIDDRKEPDDSISLTFTESPPQSAQPFRVNESPFVFAGTKFDEKLPSYFPNKKPATVESPKCPVNGKTPPHKCGRKSSESIAIPANMEWNEINSGHTTHYNSTNVKKQVYKGVLKTPSSGKVQKLKQRRSSIPENSGHVEQHPVSYKNENCYQDNHHTYQTTDKYKYNTLPQSHETKKVLSHLDPNTKYGTHHHAAFEKNAKTLKSSPRRIYNKCATLAIRLKSPPSTPTETKPDSCLNSSIDSAMRNTKQFFPNTSDTTSTSLIRSWARFRKIDFSPLKSKINSIWHRPSHEY